MSRLVAANVRALRAQVRIQVIPLTTGSVSVLATVS
jgi:hypothetical protein